MLQYEFHESIGYWLYTATHDMSRRMNAEFAELGITFRQWEVLCWISFLGEATQAQLAEGMLVEAPTLVGILDRMERDGWISRVADPKDGRRKLIRHTEKVKPVWEQMATKAREVRALATQGLSEEEVATLRRGLETIRRNISGDEWVDKIFPSTKQPLEASQDAQE